MAAAQCHSMCHSEPNLKTHMSHCCVLAGETQSQHFKSPRQRQNVQQETFEGFIEETKKTDARCCGKEVNSHFLEQI